MHYDQRTELPQQARFQFGENWLRFLDVLDEGRIDDAVASLRAMLGVVDLKGKSFLDVGSGSGLFSLAARRLGARVHSFDYDRQSVSCTEELKRRYFAADVDWTIDKASILDTAYLYRLGRFDVVYSWGVLHHTGKMWEALDNISTLVGDNGQLFIAIYNDQGWISRYWVAIKRAYVRYPAMRWPLLLVHVPYPLLPSWLLRAGTGKRQERGMSIWRDHIDWIGGYPFEVARPEVIFRFFRDKEFVLREIRTTCRLGCNEFVFVRPHSS